MNRYWFFEWICMSWRLAGSSWSFFKGLHAISKLHTPLITVFGGKVALEEKENNYEKKTYDLAQKFVEHGFSVLTGGGPGIMKAANCGAASINKKRTLGITVHDIDKGYKNPCAPVVEVSDFFVRKWLLMRYSCGFIVFPGGVGTAEELFELLNRMKYGKVVAFPVVLVGVNYWRPLVDWYKNEGLKYGIIPARCADFLSITDDIDEAFKILHPECDH